jgi:hypothetical protein
MTEHNNTSAAFYEFSDRLLCRRCQLVWLSAV